MPKPVGDMPLEEKDSIVALMQAMDADPKIRPALRRLIKLKSPDTFIAEVDVPAQVDAELRADREDRAKLRQELSAQQVQQAVEAAWAKVIPSVIAAEDRPAVEKLMQDRLIGDVETGARYFKMEREAAAVPREGPARFELPWKQDRYKGLFQDPVGWRRREAQQAMQEIREGRAQLGAA